MQSSNKNTTTPRAADLALLVRWHARLLRAREQLPVTPPKARPQTREGSAHGA